MSILNTEVTLRDYPTVRIEDLETSHVAENFDIASNRVYLTNSSQSEGKIDQVEFLLRGKVGSIAEGVSMAVWMNIADEHIKVPKPDLTVDMVENSGFSTVIDGKTWEEYTVTKNGVEVDMFDSLEAGYNLIIGMKLNEVALKLIKAN